MVRKKNKKKLVEESDHATDSVLLDPTERSFLYDEVDEFQEKMDEPVMKRARERMNKNDMQQDQVLGIGGSSSEDESDEDEFFLPDDDIVDELDDKLPDDRSWGKKKQLFFGTDTTDECIDRNLQLDKEELSQLEEKTAMRLQERMAREMEHLLTDDFISTTAEEASSSSKMEVPTDVTGLTQKQKLKLLKSESPEFLPLLNDMKETGKELRSILWPVMQVVDEIPECNLRNYLTVRYRLLLNYMMTLSSYMLMRCHIPNSVSKHPVVRRLEQYRHLIKELESSDKLFGAKLKKMSEELSAGTFSTVKLNEKNSKKRKKLKILSKGNCAKVAKKGQHNDKSDEETSQFVNDDGSNDEQEHDTELHEEALDDDAKRAINYEMSKNKGLMPSRTKEQRNPRVRYKMKYQNKLKRRKGQVRTIRKELKRYDGEKSGIKLNVVKSIKIK